MVFEKFSVNDCEVTDGFKFNVDWITVGNVAKLLITSIPIINEKGLTFF